MTALEPPDPHLTDGVIRLEPLAQRDVADAWEMVQDPDIKRFTLLPTSGVDEQWVAGWIARYESAWPEGTRAGFSIRDAADGRFLGFAAVVHLDAERREGELGYMTAAAARGRGASTRAVDLLTRWCFEELGLLRLELRIDDANGPSKTVAERSGYRLDGTLRSVFFKEGLRSDTGVWSRLPSDRLSV